MRAFSEFSDCEPEFWSLVKFVSSNLGYTQRGQGKIKVYSQKTLKRFFAAKSLYIDEENLNIISKYSEKRADILNDIVQYNLMSVDEAREIFQELYKIYKAKNFSSKIPMNKQSGNKKKINYFTAIINIITEYEIKKSKLNIDSPGFNDDPRNLLYIIDSERRLMGTSSRRFDGAFPDIINPAIVWEIKEYYYSKTFGSRIADGVFETQLDGFELNELYNRTGYKVKHVFMVDAYKTWWVDGKSYLCRIIDALNAGLVDEVIFGKEVLKRWPEILEPVISKYI